MSRESTHTFDVRVPGDKSITHRALILAALSEGRCIVRRPLIGADTLSTASALRALGCSVGDLSESCTIAGMGLPGSFGAPELAVEILGYQGLGWGGEAFAAHEVAAIKTMLRSKAGKIAGGSWEVQLNIISKRILGLPEATQGR